jgi:hypothetical protein
VANCHRYQRHRRQICHRCNWHRWQIMGTISGCRHLKVNLKAKIFIYVFSTTQRWPNKIFKNFSDWRFFPFATGEYLREFSKKIEMVLMEYSGAEGKLIHEKNQKQKVSWHCPFKWIQFFPIKITFLYDFVILANYGLLKPGKNYRCPALD